MELVIARDQLPFCDKPQRASVCLELVRRIGGQLKDQSNLIVRVQGEGGPACLTILASALLALQKRFTIDKMVIDDPSRHERAQAALLKQQANAPQIEFFNRDGCQTAPVLSQLRLVADELRGRGLETIGLFRLGDVCKPQAEAMAAAIAAGEPIDERALNEMSPMGLSIVLKAFLRTLPSALFPEELVHSYAKLSIAEQKVFLNEQLPSKLGSLQFQILEMLRQVAKAVQAKEAINRMSLKAIAICIGPNTVRSANLQDELALVGSSTAMLETFFEI